MFNSLTELNNAIRDFESKHHSRFVTLKKEKEFGNEERPLINSKSRIRYEDSQPNILPHIGYNGIPFIVAGRKVLECHQGKDREKGRKEKRRKEIQKEGNKDHNFIRKRNLIQPTKKKNCPAKIRIRHIIRFPDFKVGETTKCAYNKFYERDAVSGKLKQVLAQPQSNLKVVHQYFVSFPEQSEHANHLCGESASLVQSLDERLKKHLRTMVWEHNITSGPQMRVLLEVHLKEALFKGEDLPEKTNKRFWPSKRDLQNHIALAIKKQRNSNVDQEIVADLVQGWKEDHSSDHFFLRLKDAVDDNEDDNGDGVSENKNETDDDIDDEILLRQEITDRLYGAREKLLYVHQTQWQSRLLIRYGQEISLLDATYRTTRYSLPLYFICVPTNVGYINVATFITETEDGESLKEALSIIKEWNPLWSPKYFMCDYAEEEISSLESIFPESFVYLCDFHREQSWDRWLSATHNGMNTKKGDALELLRAIAKSNTEEDFLTSLSTLKESSLWTKNKRFQNWLEKKWLKCYKRWVRAYRQERFNVSVNTNNGIERQNLSLKYEYLDMKKARSLSQLLSILVNKFLPDSYTRYKRMNVASSDMYKNYDASIPPFLHNRPKFVVQHCFKRWIDGQNIPSDNVDQVNDSTFLVKSASQINQGFFFEV